MISAPSNPFHRPMLSVQKVFLRPLLLSPAEAEFARRGFLVSSPQRCAELERIGKAFIDGYNTALMADGISDIRIKADGVDPDLRGFAAEGSAMGVAIGDAFSLRTPRLPVLLAEFDRDFSYLAHVGCGWAMARLPWRRKAILRSLDPLLRWLAFDGMGFHDAYFKPQRIAGAWRRIKQGYGGRAYDQGVGRALWFISGGSVPAVVEILQRLSPERHGDLWAGLGLAMAYAGSGETADFADASSTAGIHRRHFAQGIAFACEARGRAGLIPPYTDAAARAVCAMSALEIAGRARVARNRLPVGDVDTPDYELWRRRVSGALAQDRREAA